MVAGELVGEKKGKMCMKKGAGRGGLGRVSDVLGISRGLRCLCPFSLLLVGL